MALARTNRLTGASGAAHGTGSHASSAFTPSNSSLLVVVETLINQADGTNIATAATLTGGSLTWTKRVTVNHNFDTFSLGLVIWTAPVTTGASMTLTFDAGAQDVYGFKYHVVDFTGHDTSTPTGATASDDTLANPGGAMTLSGAPAAESYVIAARIISNESGLTTASPGSGWAEIYDDALDAVLQLETQERTGSISTSVSWTDVDDANAGGLCVGGALEIKAAAEAGGGQPRVKRFGGVQHAHSHSPHGGTGGVKIW